MKFPILPGLHIGYILKHHLLSRRHDLWLNCVLRKKCFYLLYYENTSVIIFLYLPAIGMLFGFCTGTIRQVLSF